LVATFALVLLAVADGRDWTTLRARADGHYDRRAAFAVRLFKVIPSRPSFEAYVARCMARPAFQRAEKIAAG
jgi:glutathione S-transferase